MKKLLSIILLATMLCLAGCSNPESGNDDKNPGDNTQIDTPDEEGKEPDENKFIKVTVRSSAYYGIRGVEQELGCTIITDEPVRAEGDYITYTFTIDTTYANVINGNVMMIGFGNYCIITLEEYEDIQKYQLETGRQVLYPTVKYQDRPENERDKNNANIYFVTIDNGSSSAYPDYDENGKFVPNYWKYEEGHLPTLAAEYNSLRIEGENGFIGEDGKTYFYAYARRVTYGVEVRANLCEYQAYRDYVFGSTNEN